MNDVFHFLAGALLCNCIPHLASGLQGNSFPTPFATPRGVGNSPPLVNFYWGLFNLLIGAWLLQRFPIRLEPTAPLWWFLSGAVVLGTYLALHFGTVRQRQESS